MPKQEIKRVGDVTQVFDGDILIGEIRKIRPRMYEWQSYRAKEPFHIGRCDSEVEGLAHIGYKFSKSIPRHKDAI